MKKHFTPLSFFLLTVFAGCNKEAVNKALLPQTAQISSVQSEQTSTTFSIVQNNDGTSTATLQPDSANGQDVHVYKRESDGSIANTNFNGPELDISAWTVHGSPIFLRVYLRFVDLVNIPSTAHVLSATLYLYGLSTSIVSPEGNSVYPGSPYNSYGSNRCVIEPVTGPWDQSTLTWNTQPKVSDKLHVTIPESTSQWNYDVALNDVKAMVSKAVKYPDKNYGVRMSLADEVYYRNMVFAASESSDPSKRPKLVVTYSN